MRVRSEMNVTFHLQFIFPDFLAYNLPKSLGGNMKNNHKSRHKAQNNETTLQKTLRTGGVGLLITSAIGLVLLLIGTAIALATPDPTSLVEPIGYVAIFVTALLGGLFCSKLNVRAPYLTSAVCGFGFMLLSMLFSLALPHTLDSGLNILTRLLVHALSLLCFPLGTLIGVKSGHKSPKKRRKR